MKCLVLGSFSQPSRPSQVQLSWAGQLKSKRHRQKSNEFVPFPQGTEAQVHEAAQRAQIQAPRLCEEGSERLGLLQVLMRPVHLYRDSCQVFVAVLSPRGQCVHVCLSCLYLPKR